MVHSMEYNKLQKHIAFRIRECRKEQGLSQEKLSKLESELEILKLQMKELLKVK